MFIYPIYNHNWRNISTIYTYNKTSIKRNIIILKKIHREVGRAKDLSAPLYSQEVENFHVIQGTRNFITSAQHILRQMTPVQTIMPQLYQVTHRLLTLKFPNTIYIFYYIWGHSRVSQQIREPE